MIGIMLFLLVMGHQLLLPSLDIPRLPSLTDQPTPDEKEAYLTKVSYIVTWLQGLRGKYIRYAECRI